VAGEGGGREAGRICEIILEDFPMRAWIAFLVGLTPWLASAADAYPSRPIRIIILVVPGGGADITSRAVGQKLTEAWGQQAIVDNRPGGNGIVGMEIAKNANPTATPSCWAR
jgi:tripartite-type tricarboxylate transporter receptor subunit TctC